MRDGTTGGLPPGIMSSGVLLMEKAGSCLKSLLDFIIT